MATITINKDDGIFVYEDYLKGRAALRIKELNSTTPSQSIRRSSNGDVEAILVSEAWYTARTTAFASAATFATSDEVKDDDFMGWNLVTMIDLIRGRAQTKERISKINNQGITSGGFKVYDLIELKEYYVDNSSEIEFEPTTKVGGDSKAYLIHPSHFAALSATPVDTIYAGTGDGTLDVQALKPGGAVVETITVTATSATSFDVVGTVTGAIGTLTVGTLFESTQICLLITAGGTPFAATDVFTIDSVASGI